MMTLKKSALLVRKGFTLIEMLIVIGIIGIMLTFAVRNFTGLGGTAEITKARADIGSISTLLQAYKTLGGTYPSDSQGLQALVTKPTTSPKPKSWIQQMPEVPLDPWDGKLQYKRSGSVDSRNPEIISSGPDGIFGNDDDISSQNL